MRQVPTDMQLGNFGLPYGYAPQSTPIPTQFSSLYGLNVDPNTGGYLRGNLLGQFANQQLGNQGFFGIGQNIPQVRTPGVLGEASQQALQLSQNPQMGNMSRMAMGLLGNQ